MPIYTTTSYLLSAAAVVLVLHFHLLPAVFAGLAVYVLTLKLARHIPTNVNRFARQLALGVVVICVIVALTGVVAATWSFIGSRHGIAKLLQTLAETLGSLRKALPPSAAELLPTSIEGIREYLLEMLGDHMQKVSVIGIESVKVFAHILLGMVVGGLAALHHFQEHEKLTPFLRALRCRLSALASSFDKVVFAQVKISGLNASLTAFYLLVALPYFGIHLPLATILVLFTFAVGLLPVVGNLISNTVITIISLGISPMVGASSLLFLILIHKAEYFMNARIVGNQVQATAWELLSAMLLMEAVFGVVGLVAAPVVYAWVKAEIKVREMI